MRAKKIGLVCTVAGLLLAGRADNVEAQGRPGPAVAVKDANGVVLGRVVSLPLTTDSIPSQVVVLTSSGYLVAIGMDGTPVAMGNVSFATKDCTGQAYAASDHGSPHITASVTSWVAYHSRMDKYVSATGPAAATTPASFIINRLGGKGTGCDINPGGLAPGNFYPVRLLTAADVGLPATIKAPLTIHLGPV